MTARRAPARRRYHTMRSPAAAASSSPAAAHRGRSVPPSTGPAPVGGSTPAAAYETAATDRTNGGSPESFRAEPPATRRAREPQLPVELLRALQDGRLEQTCPRCGRWEAAGWYCSWCFAPMEPARDWYGAEGRGDTPTERSADSARRKAEQRAARLPQVAPDPAPPEYRESAASWPSAGRWPGTSRVAPVEGALGDERAEVGSTPTPPKSASSQERASVLSGALSEADASPSVAGPGQP